MEDTLLCTWQPIEAAVMFAVPLLLTLAAGAPPAASSSFPGGLLSTSGRAAYLGTNRGLVALDLTNGEVLWRSDESHRPLTVAGDRLFALALSDTNEARVLGHDLGRRGACAFRSGPVTLPRWAVTVPGQGHTFTYVARQVREELILEWHATARASTGPGKEARGQARVNLRTGHVKAERPAAPTAEPPQPGALAKLAVRWHRSLAGHLHALVLEELPGSGERRRLHRFVLRGWEERSGKEMLSRELMRGGSLVVMIGQGDRHLWIREATPSPDGPSEGAAQHWSVFSGVDGRLVARVPVLPGTRQGLVLNGRAYCLTTRSRPISGGGARARHTLHALDLQTGRESWKRDLEDEK